MVMFFFFYFPKFMYYSYTIFILKNNSNNKVGSTKQSKLSFAKETINTSFLPLLIPEKY